MQNLKHKPHQHGLTKKKRNKTWTPTNSTTQNPLYNTHNILLAPHSVCHQVRHTLVEVVGIDRRHPLH